MAYRITPYAYRQGKTFLHRTPAGIKLLGLFLISVTAFFPGYGQGAAALLIFWGALSAKIRPWELLRGSLPLMTTSLFVILFRSIRIGSIESRFLTFSFSGFIAGIFFGAGILLAFSAGSLLFSVTTMTELRDSLGVAEAFFRKRGEKPKLSVVSLCFSLMLGFLPRFFEIWDDMNKAYQARSGKNSICKILLLIPVVTERMIESALKTAAALEIRGFYADPL
ncbi:MAG: energy-coupling factor transporter transmembrane protein EcfT [Spirochaetaceae bacterium]|nr:energy-coupling factor transporter transmembrane protein EcfT [Spirochaetaceae bacterium]